MRQAVKRTHEEGKIVVRAKSNRRGASRFFRQLCIYGAVLATLMLNLASHAQDAPAYVDPQIKAALSEISAGQIQSDIEKLVSFQTRSTISAQDAASLSKGQGI